MTIEIRELVIQASISENGNTLEKRPLRTIAQEVDEEARWIERISRRVLEQLREERGWNQ